MNTLKHIDYALFQFINNDLSNAFFDSIMPLIRNRDTWIPFYAIVLVVLLWQFGWKRGLVLVAASILCVTLTDQISSSLFKPFFERLRPCQSELEFNLLVRCSVSYSFTSSHAANHFGLATFWSLIFLKKLKWLMPLFFVWASLICFAQIYVGVHFPGDILGGMLIGILSAYSVYSLLNLLKSKLF